MKQLRSVSQGRGFAPLLVSVINTGGAMLLFKTQPIRDYHKVTWYEELLLGAVSSDGDTWTDKVISSVQDAMSYNTAYKYIAKLIDRGFLTPTRDTKDKRFVNVALTNRAKEYLRQIEEAAWTNEQ